MMISYRIVSISITQIVLNTSSPLSIHAVAISNAACYIALTSTNIDKRILKYVDQTERYNYQLHLQWRAKMEWGVCWKSLTSYEKFIMLNRRIPRLLAGISAAKKVSLERKHWNREMTCCGKTKINYYYDCRKSYTSHRSMQASIKEGEGNASFEA